MAPADLFVTRFGVDWWGCIEEGGVEEAWVELMVEEDLVAGTVPLVPLEPFD